MSKSPQMTNAFLFSDFDPSKQTVDEYVATLEPGSEKWKMRSRLIYPSAYAPAPHNSAKPAQQQPKSPGTPEVIFPWLTAAEFYASAPEEVAWVWKDYVARGAITEITAKVKTGKSTLEAHMSRAIANGETFLGRPTVQGPVLIVTEEGSTTMRELLARARLEENWDVHMLSWRAVSRVAWTDLLDAVRRKAIETGAVLIVFDTLSKVAGLKDDEEQSSGKATEVMEPLQVLVTEMNIAAVVARHDRKSGGEVGDSGRGSSGFSGDVDIIVQITRDARNEKRRVLNARSRFDETPDKLTIELTADGYREVIVDPDSRQSDVSFHGRQLMRPVYDFIAKTPGCSQKAITDHIEGRREDIIEAARLLAAEGYIRVEPRGKARTHYPVPGRVLDARRAVTDEGDEYQ